MAFADPAITRLLHQIDEGATVAPERLFALVYDDLRRRAGGMMSAERGDHTLQPTALVHEAFLKVARPGVSFESRLHFFNAAALAMRRILVDHAAAHKAGKRGGGWGEMRLDEVDASARPIDIIALDDALKNLERLSPRRAQVVQLRFFAGLKDAEIAELLQVAVKTIRRDWSAARVWLHTQMRA